MARLIYTGTDPQTQWVAGWPASDHDDDDAESAAAKVASGLYRLATSPARTTRKPGGEQDEQGEQEE